MACFITPLVAGLLIKIIRRFLLENIKGEFDILELMLIGGSLILMIEHMLNGEITPYPPFLTAMSSPVGIPILVREITLVGGSMTFAVFGVWLGILLASKTLKIETIKLHKLGTLLKIR